MLLFILVMSIIMSYQHSHLRYFYYLQYSGILDLLGSCMGFLVFGKNSFLIKIFLFFLMELIWKELLKNSLKILMPHTKKVSTSLFFLTVVLMKNIRQFLLCWPFPQLNSILSEQNAGLRFQ